MFYGTHFIMSPPAKSKLKRQSQLLSSMLSRTLSYKYRDLDTTFSSLGASDDPAELSTQLSAPGVLKVFGDSVCTGTHYKSVLATGTSSARELVKEALERYALSPECASQYVLCDVVGQAGDSGQQWRAECFRVFGDNEKPLLIQELWKPREGLSRRFELRKRSDVEELAAKDVDTMTAGEKGRRFRKSGGWPGENEKVEAQGSIWGRAQEGVFLCGSFNQAAVETVARLYCRARGCSVAPDAVLQCRRAGSSFCPAPRLCPWPQGAVHSRAGGRGVMGSPVGPGAPGESSGRSSEGTWKSSLQRRRGARGAWRPVGHALCLPIQLAWLVKRS